MQPESTVVCQIRRARAALVEATLDDEDEDSEESEEGGDSKEVSTEASADKPAE